MVSAKGKAVPSALQPLTSPTMNKIFSSAKDPSLDTLKADVQTLQSDAAGLARDRLFRPAADSARNAQEAFDETVKRTQDVLENGLAQTQETFNRQKDQAASWISANPFAAVGLAVLAGMLLSPIGRGHR
jgi:ElaB/YqjD/DUF883 family membrane-anchored ribosome-binding protein